MTEAFPYNLVSVLLFSKLKPCSKLSKASSQNCLSLVNLDLYISEILMFNIAENL